MDILTGLTLAAPAGLNAYIPLLAVALAERFGWLTLSSPWDLLGEWWAIGLIAVLLVVEIVADKVPAVDHVNDVAQTVVRPAAGGLLAVAAAGDVDASSVMLLVCGVLIAGGVHSVKATARPVVNATTAGIGAPVVSTLEDILALVMTVLAFVVPVLAAVAVIALVVAALLLVRRWKRRRAGPSPA
jgi:uncharacterized membrane protein